MRGRPKGRMTPLRRRANDVLAEMIGAGQPVMVAAVARKLGVDRRSARRIIRSIKIAEPI